MRTAELAALVDVVSQAPTRDIAARDWVAYISAITRREAGKPFITWYDDATGERIELSYTTFANWVWKTANYVRDGLDVQPGDHVAVRLRTHWQTVAIWYAVWAAGASVVPNYGDGTGSVDVSAVFVQEDAIDEILLARKAPAVVGLSLRPMAARLRRTPPGVEDYAIEVPSYGDGFATPAGAALTGPAVAGRSGIALIAAAAAAGQHLALTPADRILCLPEVVTTAAFVGTVLAVFDAGAGIVLSPGADPARLDRRRTDERITVEVR